MKGDKKMKGKYLRTNEIFVVVGRGESLIYRKKDGGKFEALLNVVNSGVSRFRELPDSDQRNPKKKLKNCNVIKIDTIRTGFYVGGKAIRLLYK